MAIDIKRLIRFSDDEAARLMIFYSEAEREILTELNRALLTTNEKAYLETMHHNVGVILQDLEAGSKTWCSEAIPRGVHARQPVCR